MRVLMVQHQQIVFDDGFANFHCDVLVNLDTVMWLWGNKDILRHYCEQHIFNIADKIGREKYVVLALKHFRATDSFNHVYAFGTESKQKSTKPVLQNELYLTTVALKRRHFEPRAACILYKNKMFHNNFWRGI